MSNVTFHIRTDSMSLDRRFTKKCQALEGHPGGNPGLIQSLSSGLVPADSSP
jgi:hypothetical protein